MNPSYPRAHETNETTLEASHSQGPLSPRDGRRRWVWLGGAVVVVLSAWMLFLRASRGQATSNKSVDGPATRGVPVVTAAVKQADMPVYITGLGTVTALNTISVRSRVDGQLLSVAYREGETVHKGDLLAEIDPRAFQVELSRTEGQRAKDEAALENAQIDLERYQVLFEQGSIPKQQLDTQVAMVNQDEAALKTDQAQIDSAKLNLQYSRITAPMTGRVGLRIVDPGNIVHANDQSALVVITQMQPIAVVFSISADDLQRMPEQSRAGRRLIVEAYDRELKRKLATGSLLAIDNQIDQNTGTVRLKASFQNDDNALFPNQFVNARLLVNSMQGAVIVPTAALQRSPDSTFVYVVGPDSTVETRTVDIQLTEGDDTSVRGKVSPGDVVVIDGVDKLRPGIKVAAVMADEQGARKGKQGSK